MELDVLDRIGTCGVLPVIKVPSLEKAVPLAAALRRGGINTLEITVRNEIALDAIREIRRSFPDMLVGAGTILNTGLVEQAKEAGALFCVAPGFNPETAAYCRQIGMPFVPGCTTASEMENAAASGLRVLKFFPAESSGGTAALKLFHGPFSKLRFIPTGGLSFHNLHSYLSLDYVLACGGSFMAKADLIQNERWDEIEALCRRAVAVAEAARGKTPPAPAIDRTRPFPYPPGEKIVGFGDLLVSFNPEGYRRFLQADTMRVNYTGAEANVLASLSSFGLETEFVTRVPDNPISACALAALSKCRIGTDRVLLGGDRIGVIYTERGAAQRPSRVVYDRMHTALCEIRPEEVDWDAIFRDAGWFHFTGITAALSDETARCCLDACRAAKAKGVPISCDLNYRKKLWSEEKARKVMGELVRYVDVLIANEEDADKVLGIRSKDTDVETGKLNREGYREVAEQICARYGVKKVGISLWQSLSASDNIWSTMFYDGSDAYFSREYPIHIVNRVGGGDAFAAGLIYSLFRGFDARKTVEFAAAASCLKHSLEEDFNLVSVEEVLSLMEGGGSGRVQR